MGQPERKDPSCQLAAPKVLGVTLRLSKPLAQSVLVGTRHSREVSCPWRDKGVRRGPSSPDRATSEVSPGLQESIQKRLEKNRLVPSLRREGSADGSFLYPKLAPSVQRAAKAATRK